MRTHTSDRGLTLVLLGLTAATGMIDAISYLGMGHVLVANMTGNLVFLGFALVGAKGFSIAPFAVALASFLFGAGLGGRLGVMLRGNRRRWLGAASTLQTLLAAAAAIAAVTIGVGPTGTARFGVIALLGIGTGIQNATVRRLSIPDLTTTVLTMTLTGLAADSALAGGTHPRRARRIGSVAAMLAGALAGAALMVHAGIATALILLTAVLAAVTVGLAAFTQPSIPEPSRTKP